MEKNKVIGIVYLIENKLNGKKYVGQTVRTLKLRLYFHLRGHTYISNALRKYGVENFNIKALKECCTKEELNAYEKHFIKEFDTTNLGVGYNLTSGGEGSIGFKHTAETIKKLKLACIGRVFSQETRNKISKSNSGHVNPHKGKTLIQHFGEEKAKEIKLKISKSSKQHNSECKCASCKSRRGEMSGKSNPMYGRVGVLHPHYGKYGINNGKRGVHLNGVEKFIKPEDLDMFISNGWFLGRTKVTKKRDISSISV
jgi:group I intron endonuclease